MLHTLEDHVKAVAAGACHALEQWGDLVLLTDNLFSPFDRDFVVARECIHSVLIIRGPLAKHLLIDHVDAEQVSEKIDYLFGARKAAEISVDDDAVETVVYKDKQVPEQFRESLHCVTSADDMVRRRIAKEMAWPRIKRGPGKRWVEGKTFRLAEKVGYIQRRAADHDSRVVTIGQLVLFSAETGDAWLLDVADQLAAPIAREGKPLSVDIQESDTGFSVDWTGSFKIEGEAFIYRSKESRGVRTIFGYPTTLVMKQILNMFG